MLISVTLREQTVLMYYIGYFFNGFVLSQLIMSPS